MVWLGFSAGRMIGWPTTESIFLGAILSISSTTIIAKALDELGETRTEYARVVMGILIVEDLAAVVMLVLLSSVARAGTVAIGQATLALGGVTLFVVVTSIVGLLVVPRILQAVAQTSAHEVLIVTVLGFCFGVAILASSLGLSVALGAFLIGAVMAETKQVHQIEERIDWARVLSRHSPAVTDPEPLFASAWRSGRSANSRSSSPRSDGNWEWFRRTCTRSPSPSPR